MIKPISQYFTFILKRARHLALVTHHSLRDSITLQLSKRGCSTSFPGSLLFTPQEAREGRPWLGLVTCLPKSGRLQISDWREGRLSVSLPILNVPGMGKHASVRINLQNRACFKGHVKWSRNPQKDV